MSPAKVSLKIKMLFLDKPKHRVHHNKPFLKEFLKHIHLGEINIIPEKFEMSVKNGELGKPVILWMNLTKQ